MPRGPIVTEVVVDGPGAAAFLAPRSDVVVDQVEGDRAHGDGLASAAGPGAEPHLGTTTFAMVRGPFRRYERTVEVEATTDGRYRVRQVVDARLGIGVWNVLFDPPMRRALARAGGRSPWWAPPAVLDAQGAAALASLGMLSVIGGYLGTLITQTLTYAAEEFGAGERAQGDTLAAVRIGVLLAMVVAAWADRAGRRRALLASAAGGCALTALGALAPGLVWLGGTQVLARGLATALGLLIVVVVAEEMPAGSRAWGVSLLTMAGGLGAGIVLWFLPIVDLDDRFWRLLYVFPLLFLPLIRSTATLLPESRRFTRRHASAHFAGHGRRLALLASTTLALAVFSSPASQLQNEFLRDRFDFSAVRITLFTILTVTPGSIGIVLGGRLADRRGKRLVGGIGLLAGAALTAVQYVAPNEATTWAASAVGSIVGGLAVPALAVYGPELFPTALRTKANVAITTAGVGGSVLGLVVAGRLADRWSLGPAIAVLATVPVLAALVLIPRYPETAGRELEELNPEDAMGPLPGPPATS